jgi:tetratricopeptide (TPR) repeat protein
MYKPVLAIIFVVTIIFGVLMFTDRYELDKTLFVKMLGSKSFNSYHQGSYLEPIAYFNTAIAMQLNDSDALNDIGSDLSDLGNDNEAIGYYDRALAIEPNHVDSLYDKARSLNRLGNYTEAIVNYDRALAIEPNHTDALNNRGNIFRNLGNYTEAIVNYDRALAIEPNHTLALANKGLTLTELGKFKEAIIYFDKALVIEPNSAFTLNHKAQSLYLLGNHTEAVEDLDRVLTIEPNHEEALALKGLIYNMASSNFLTYQHPDLGFAVQYPSDSEVNEHVDGVVFLTQKGSILINMRQLSEEQTLEQFTDERKFSLQESFENVSLAETTPTTLGGYPAYETIFNFDSFDYPGERMLGWLVTNVINGTTSVQLLFAGDVSTQPPYDFINTKNTFNLSRP